MIAYNYYYTRSRKINIFQFYVVLEFIYQGSDNVDIDEKLIEKRGRIKPNRAFKIDDNNVMSEGYGNIPKRVMRDKRLSIEAKSIYSYLCSYAGGGNEAFPSVGRMIMDLRISENRFYKHAALLIEYGYLRKHREQSEGNLLGNNIYELVQVLE